MCLRWDFRVTGRMRYFGNRLSTVSNSSLYTSAINAEKVRIHGLIFVVGLDFFILPV